MKAYIAFITEHDLYVGMVVFDNEPSLDKFIESKGLGLWSNESYKIDKLIKEVCN